MKTCVMSVSFPATVVKAAIRATVTRAAAISLVIAFAVTVAAAPRLAAHAAQVKAREYSATTPKIAAAPSVVAEAPDVMVVMDGRKIDYSDVPLMINDSRILLPFREALTALGVPNDREHIVWNDKERSVTVNNGDDVIRLVVGDPIMTLNGAPVKFDVAPYIYPANNRVYVPIRAIAELTDRLVSWDGVGSAAYIRDKSSYAKTVEILENLRRAVSDETPERLDHAVLAETLENFGRAVSAEAGDAANNRFSIVESELISLAKNDENAQEITRSSVITEVDNINRVARASKSWFANGEETKFEAYIIDGAMFSREIGGEEYVWTKTAPRRTPTRSALEPLIEALSTEELAMRCAAFPTDGAGNSMYKLVGQARVPDTQPSILGLATAFFETGYVCPDNQIRFEIRLDDRYLPIDERFTYTAVFVPGKAGASTPAADSLSAFAVTSKTALTYRELEPARRIEIPDEILALTDADLARAD